jgi:hypothetical protein
MMKEVVVKTMAMADLQDEKMWKLVPSLISTKFLMFKMHPQVRLS